MPLHLPRRLGIHCQQAGLGTPWLLVAMRNVPREQVYASLDRVRCARFCSASCLVGDHIQVIRGPRWPIRGITFDVCAPSAYVWSLLIALVTCGEGRGHCEEEGRGTCHMFWNICFEIWRVCFEIWNMCACSLGAKQRTMPGLVAPSDAFPYWHLHFARNGFITIHVLARYVLHFGWQGAWPTTPTSCTRSTWELIAGHMDLSLCI